MKAFKVFIFGLLYGWFLKFAFDRIYRGNEMEDIRNENASLREYIRFLESKLQPESLETKSVRRTVSQSGFASDQTATEKDDLKQIKGIGPATEKKLNEAGIHTFADLAGLTAQELRNLLGNSKLVAQNADRLIRQAQELVYQLR
jgi:predicted flap endonuclease-1-like 5' DNA nuclease